MEKSSKVIMLRQGRIPNVQLFAAQLFSVAFLPAAFEN